MSKRGEKRVREIELILPEWANDLATKGYMVIPNVVDQKTCVEVRDQILTWFENLGTGIDRTNLSTFTPANLPTSIRGIYQQYGLGANSAAWSIRQHPAVHQTFAKLWGTDDLVTSIDAVCVMPPTSWDNGKRWFHFDQGPRKLGRQCIQGFVSLEDASEKDGTLVVIPGSHLHHTAFMETFGAAHAKHGDWIKFDAQEVAWLQERCPIKELRVASPQGSLVLWDSRTAHCNSYPLRDRAVPDRWRFVVYCCQSPLPENAKERQKVLKKKREAFQKHRITNHWPTASSKLFPLKAQFGRPPSDFLLPTDVVHLSPLGQKLAGFG